MIGVQAWAERFYNSGAWHRCRTGYIRERIGIDGGRCEACGEAQGYIVHHKIALTPENVADPDVALNWGNLQYVCKNCHDRFEGHGLSRGAAPCVVFDASGQPVARVTPPV